MKYGLSSDKRRDFYRSNKWSSDAGLGLQRAWMGFFGYLCPEVPQVCWGGRLELGSRFFTKQCQCITDLLPSWDTSLFETQISWQVKSWSQAVSREALSSAKASWKICGCCGVAWRGGWLNGIFGIAALSEKKRCWNRKERGWGALWDRNGEPNRPVVERVRPCLFWPAVGLGAAISRQNLLAATHLKGHKRLANLPARLAPFKVGFLNQRNGALDSGALCIFCAAQIAGLFITG